MRTLEELVEKRDPAWPPEFWPPLPASTREALEQIVSILDPVARKLHSE